MTRQTIDAPPPRTKVLYIAGWGRSGSTLIDQLLGQKSGWRSCGELREIWMNPVCGCGARVHSCEFWHPVLARTIDNVDGVSHGRLAVTQERWLRSTPRALAAVARLFKAHPPAWSDLASYAERRELLYRYTAEEANARVIIDSSKNPADALLLGSMPNTDAYLLHLVRDPRGCAYSWGKKKVLPDPPLRHLETLGPLQSSLFWLRWNLTIGTVVQRQFRGRSLTLRYEEFTRDPAGSIAAIHEMVDGVSPQASKGERTVLLPLNHMVGGNPRRFAAVGETTIREDAEWKSAMNRRDRLLATAAAAPLMTRYGYSVHR